MSSDTTQKNNVKVGVRIRSAANTGDGCVLSSAKGGKKLALKTNKKEQLFEFDWCFDDTIGQEY
jgi:hypothetical protein